MEYVLVIFFTSVVFMRTLVLQMLNTLQVSLHTWSFFFLCIWADFNFSGCNEKYL